MKRIILSLTVIASFFAINSNAQLHDEQSVTVTMDLQPILQLDMDTPNQLEFVFDEISEYYGGITQYSATILKVSSTVSWDLYAVGRSNGSIAAGFWDQHIEYGSNNANAIDQIPLSCVELHQSQANSGDGAATTAGAAFNDYSQAFADAGAVNHGNSLYAVLGAQTAPAVTNKYIAGHKGTSGTAGEDFIPGGTWMTQTGLTSDYYYSIDYRIVPGLPAIFPNAAAADGTTAQDIVTDNAAGNYAEPGIYTMFVQYVLLEDQ